MQLTDFNKLFEEEISQFKTSSSSDISKNHLVRQFKEAVWVCFFWNDYYSSSYSSTHFPLCYSVDEDIYNLSHWYSYLSLGLYSVESSIFFV